MSAGSLVSAIASFALCALLGVFQAQRISEREKALCALSALIGELHRQAVIGGRTLQKICDDLAHTADVHICMLAHIFVEHLGGDVDRAQVRRQLRKQMGLGEGEADLAAWLLGQVQSPELARVRQSVQYAEQTCATMLDQFRTSSARQRSLYMKLGALGGLVCFNLCI